MKKVIVLFLILPFIFMLFSALPAHADIPQKVTVQKINIYGNTGDFDNDGDTEVKNGKLIYETDMHAGQRLVDVSNIEYNLDFWNVGEEGGKKGMLFWKKDYGLATLTFNYEFADPGFTVKKGPDFEQLHSFKFEDASSEPGVKPVVYHFKFSGGPNGSFEEIQPYVSRSGPATGNVIHGNLVSLNFPHDDNTQYPYGITARWLKMPWQISGDPFYGYPDGEGYCDSLLSKNHINPSRYFIPTVYAKDSGARFTDFTGEVTVAPGHDLEDEVPAELEMVLAEGDHINTGAQSCAIIGFSDMTTFILKPFTTVILAPSPEKESKFELLTGKIWANIKKMVKNGTMDVKLNQAVAGIKGTTLVLENTDDTSTIKVIEGSVEYTSLANGKKVMVNTGETVDATSKGLSEKKTFDIEKEQKNWHNPPYTDKTAADTGQGSAAQTIMISIGALIVLGLIVLAVFMAVKKSSAKKLKN